MTVEIRRAGSEWLIEVKGEPIGIADSSSEARELAEYWAAKLDCVATWRVGQSKKARHVPEVLTRLLVKLKRSGVRKQQNPGRLSRGSAVSPPSD